MTAAGTAQHDPGSAKYILSDRGHCNVNLCPNLGISPMAGEPELAYL
jgi:hypothetical protein